MFDRDTCHVGEYSHAALVAHWTFDENGETTAHDSAGSNTGTLLNGTGWTSGVSGSAVSLDGVNDYVTVPDNPSLRFTQSSSFTISFWAKPNAISGGDVISKMRASGQSGVFGYEVRLGANAFANFHVESSNEGYLDIDTGAGSVLGGKWYYVTAVYNNKNMKVYLDGMPKGSGTFNYNTGTTSPDGPLAIGARVANSSPMANWYFGGSVDDVRIYNEALSDAKILELYQTTPEPATLLLLGLGGVMLRKRS